MHIMEGYLPLKHAALWTIAMAVITSSSVKEVRRQLNVDSQTLLKLGAAIGFCFLLSSLKVPSITGSSSHPTGIGLGTLLLGPHIMPLVGVITLLFQALLLAHGGLTTLGANAFSLAIFGPWCVYFLFIVMQRLKLPMSWKVFIASSVGGLAVYGFTAFQLALAFHDGGEGIGASWLRFLLIFAPTQIPLSLAEGILTVVCVKALGRSKLGFDNASRD
jgi:cobalt/nickel transport system permease protein